MASRKSARKLGDLVPASVAIARQPPSDFTSATDYIPEHLSLRALQKASLGCQACDLWRTGRQTVFGEGRRSARLVLIGEQPGREEDDAGKPFVGPAGRLLDTALDAAGIDRSDTYVTNAVKHFKWERPTRTIPVKSTARDDKRIHKTPNTAERRACRPWLDAELRVIAPSVVLCLGATAAQSIFGTKFRVTHHRGKPLDPPIQWIDEAKIRSVPTFFVTVHPSAVLRSPTVEDRAKAMKLFFADVARVGAFLQRTTADTRS